MNHAGRRRKEHPVPPWLYEHNVVKLDDREKAKVVLFQLRTAPYKRWAMLSEQNSSLASRKW